MLNLDIQVVASTKQNSASNWVIPVKFRILDFTSKSGILVFTVLNPVKTRILFLLVKSKILDLNTFQFLLIHMKKTRIEPRKTQKDAWMDTR